MSSASTSSSLGAAPPDIQPPQSCWEGVLSCSRPLSAGTPREKPSALCRRWLRLKAGLSHFPSSVVQAPLERSEAKDTAPHDTETTHFRETSLRLFRPHPSHLCLGVALGAELTAVASATCLMWVSELSFHMCQCFPLLFSFLLGVGGFSAKSEET